MTGTRETIFLINGPRTNTNDKLPEEQDFDMMLVYWFEQFCLGTLNLILQFQEQGYSCPCNSLQNLIQYVLGH